LPLHLISVKSNKGREVTHTGSPRRVEMSSLVGWIPLPSLRRRCCGGWGGVLSPGPADRRCQRSNLGGCEKRCEV